MYWIQTNRNVSWQLCWLLQTPQLWNGVCQDLGWLSAATTVTTIYVNRCELDLVVRWFKTLHYAFTVPAASWIVLITADVGFTSLLLHCTTFTGLTAASFSLSHSTVVLSLLLFCFLPLSILLLSQHLLFCSTSVCYPLVPYRGFRQVVERIIKFTMGAADAYLFMQS